MISQHQERVASEKVVHERTKEVRVTAGQRARGDEFQRLTQGSVLLVDTTWIITSRLDILGLVCRQSEQEEVLGADLLTDLDICTVQCTDCQSAV